jgi:alpha-glucosidase
VFVYNGEELGLPNVELPDDVLQDPTWERSGHEERGRDGCRVPMPWTGDAAPYGFSTNADTWLPMPDDWAPMTVAVQAHDAESTLTLYRRAIELRHGRGDFSGSEVEFLDGAPGVVAFRGDDGLVCVLNTGSSPVDLPAGELLIASGPVTDVLPPDTAAWMR